MKSKNKEIIELPQLFGIKKSNRDFSDAYYWGKNQFNSSFPVALACYIRSLKKPLVYVEYDTSVSTLIGNINVEKVWGSDRPNEELHFSFETRFDAFRMLVHDELPSIDLVVCDGNSQKQIRPLEIKLTTLPDSTTEKNNEDMYGTELVIRSATSRYMALSMAVSVQDVQPEVKKIFDPIFGKIRDWDSIHEIVKIAPKVIEALEIFLDKFKNKQQPLLLQPIWKTIGKSPILASQCLDIFVWSDFALVHLFLDSARNSAHETEKVSRHLRAALRLSRFLWEASKGGKVYQAPIYDGMTYNNQNDKEFSISGVKTRSLMSCPRLITPAVSKDEIKQIILGGGHKHLSPERRFDAILFFSTDIFEGK
jgi:HindVP restriction endonuclease